jgi:hypothetical protein
MLICNLPLAQPRARSAVFGVDEDNAGLFERALYCLDGAWPHRVPALKALYRVIRYFGRAAELRHAPAESRPREETLNPKNWSHHIRASNCAPLPACHSPTPVCGRDAPFIERLRDDTQGVWRKSGDLPDYHSSPKLSPRTPGMASASTRRSRRTYAACSPRNRQRSYGM